MEIGVALILAAIAGATLYLKSYIDQKAKLLANREEFQELVRQQEVTARVTEEIRAQIGGGLWLDQQRWSRKLDTFIELFDFVVAANDLALHAVFLNDRTPEQRAIWFHEALSREEASRPTLRRSRALARMLFRPAVSNEFEKCEHWLRALAFTDNMRQVISLLGTLSRDVLEHTAREDLAAFPAATQAELEKRDQLTGELDRLFHKVHTAKTEPEHELEAAETRMREIIDELERLPVYSRYKAYGGNKGLLQPFKREDGD